MSRVANRSELTLGILAGGRGSRLGGVDKCWIRRDGVSQVLRWRDRFASDVDIVLVSTQRIDDRFGTHGLATVADQGNRLEGPIAGLEALAAVCTTPWLLTVPVDTVELPGELLARLLQQAGPQGAFAEDDDGRQPLVALWPVAGLRDAVRAAVAAGDAAVHHLLGRLGMRPVRFAGARFGNLNTPADLAAAGAAIA